MSSRDLSLTERVENTREKQPIIPVISFNLEQIKDHFDKNVESIEEQFTTAELLLSQGKIEDCKDIWRTQIVFIESALDFYMHELSKYGTLQIFLGRWPKTNRYIKILIPMDVLEEGLKNPESNNWFIEYINTKFGREVYLGLESINDQLSMLGLNSKKIYEEAFPKPDDEEEPYISGKIFVKELFKRRNQIAHQCDRCHADARKNEITREYVVYAIKNLKNLVETIHNQAVAKDSGNN